MKEAAQTYLQCGADAYFGRPWMVSSSLALTNRLVDLCGYGDSIFVELGIRDSS
jgi:hypothetical protein